jgi:cysteine desulfurase / selenocysteine lyase
MPAASLPPDLIYLDNAATSFPKPAAVGERMAAFLGTEAGNPGRSGHRLAVAAASVVSDTRRRAARLLGARNADQIVFTAGATDALNTALWGFLRPGDRVVTTTMEHNSVARPLRALEDVGVVIVRVACAPDGSLDPADVERALREAPTRLVAILHASNVTGTLLPVADVVGMAHAVGSAVLIDAAQTAGAIPIDVMALGVDLLAAPGHKGLLGPTGTGVLYVAPGVSLRPLRQGGTGTRSEDERQPEEMPDGLEAGTVNTVGIAGLGAALGVIADRGVPAIRAHEVELTERLLAGLGEIRGVTCYGPRDSAERVGVVSINVAGWEPVDLAAALDSSFGIAVRPGLHCAPAAHRTIGTFPRGTLRLSPGPFTAPSEIDRAVEAIGLVAAAARQ